MDIQDVIMNHVLRFVPAKSLCRFKSVSKAWNRWIASPFLAHQQATHFKKTSGFFFQSNQLQDPFFIPLDHPSHGVPIPSLAFLPDPTTIRSTSNGLLCCQSTFQDNIYFICNPTTKEWKELPEPTLFHGPASAIALSFTPSTFNFQSHFQLVCAVPFHSVQALYFEIYSSRTNSWRVADSQYFYDDGDLTFRGDGFCIDGIVYWEMSNDVVLGFDLRDEEHGEIQVPPGHSLQGALTEMNGELCYVTVTTCNDKNEDEDGYYSLGVYGGHDMVLKCEMPLDVEDLRVNNDVDEDQVRVLSSGNDGVVVILVGSNVVLYDVEERKGKVVVTGVFGPADRASAGRYLPYVNSLVRVCPVEKMPVEDLQVDQVLRDMGI